MISAFSVSVFSFWKDTSFNENEPVVDTPEQAIACFVRTDMDVLCLGPFVTLKPGKAI